LPDALRLLAEKNFLFHLAVDEICISHALQSNFSISRSFPFSSVIGSARTSIPSSRKMMLL
jgi:hypothetical protein